MRRTRRNARPYFLIPVKASQEVSFRRWNRILMVMLGLLVVGLLLIAFVPEAGSRSSAGSHSVAGETVH
jgi:hypothetical protein